MIPDLSRADIGASIAGARAANGVSQEELARATGLGQAIISRIESGARKVELTEALSIARALGIDLGSLLKQAETHAAERDTGVESARTMEVLAARLHDSTPATIDALDWLEPFLRRWDALERMMDE